MRSLRRAVGRLRAVHHQALASWPGLYALGHLVVIGWFLVGALAATPMGHVDFPCPEVETVEDVGPASLEPGIDGVVLVSIYPANALGGGCSRSAINVGQPSDVREVTLTLRESSLVVETTSTNHRVAVIDADAGRPVADTGGIRPVTHEIRSARPGYPFWETVHGYTIEPPTRYQTRNRSIVVIEGSIDSDPEAAAPWVLLVLVVVANGMYRIVRRLERRRPSFEPETPDEY